MKPSSAVQRRLILFCTALLMLVVGTNVVHQRLLRAAVDIEQAQTQAQAQGEFIDALYRDFIALRLSVWREALSKQFGNDPSQSFSQARAQASRRYQESIERFAESDPEQAEALLEQAQSLPLRVEQVIDSFGREREAGQPAPFTVLLDEMLSLERDLDALRQQQDSRVLALQEQAKSSGRQALTWAERLTQLAALLSAALVVFIVYQVILPLRRTAMALRELQSGRGPLDLPSVQNNEFGDMAMALRRLLENARQLDEVAYTDTLTGLSNRARLERQIADAITQHPDRGQGLVLMFIDLDHFKQVNDSFGHRLGNQYLRAAAERLRGLVPRDARLFRYSGDQFAVLIEQPAAGPRTPARVLALAEQLRAGLSSPCQLDGQMIAMSGSIGVAVHPQDAEDADELLGAADAAMFQAKSAGRDQVVVATPELTARVRRRSFLAGDIRRGIEAGEFEVYFQPVVDVGLRRVVSAEVLLRWRHPTRGLVMPTDFVPAAEESGAIGALGLYSLERACAQVERFAATGRPLKLAVNLSSAQLYNSDFVRAAAEALQRHRVNPASIEFEITESIMMGEQERSARVLHELHALGVGLCIDDFGTGYSSLSYVQKFPIQKIKIDRSFVTRVSSSREAEAIITATLAMARSLGFEVVAEGVETSAQMKRLQDMGCPLQQGFLFTPALSAGEFEYWLETSEALLAQIA